MILVSLKLWDLQDKFDLWVLLVLCVLFVPQSDQRIDSRGPPRRYQTSQQRN